MRLKACGWVLGLGAVMPWAALAQPVVLDCAVAYMPARSTWVRHVQALVQDGQVRALIIDGVAPYAFAGDADVLVTAIDNERIELRLTQRHWQSDFRGHATGQGRCDSVE